VEEGYYVVEYPQVSGTAAVLLQIPEQSIESPHQYEVPRCLRHNHELFLFESETQESKHKQLKRRKEHVIIAAARDFCALGFEPADFDSSKRRSLSSPSWFRPIIAWPRDSSFRHLGRIQGREGGPQCCDTHRRWVLLRSAG